MKDFDNKEPVSHEVAHLNDFGPRDITDEELKFIHEIHSKKYPIRLESNEIWPHIVFLNKAIFHPRIQIGDYTTWNNFSHTNFNPKYDWAGALAPYLYSNSREKLIIGKYCQFAHGTKFITESAMHQMNGFTTYPFSILNSDWKNIYEHDTPKKGDNIVGHDCWLGHDCTIMPGVKLGNGVIVGSCSVVTKDVPDYCIVGGNPATIIRKRFSDEVIARLLEIAWWDWPFEKAARNLRALFSQDINILEKVGSWE